jgi:hypothetical protein
MGIFFLKYMANSPPGDDAVTFGYPPLGQIHDRSGLKRSLMMPICNV